MLNIPQLANVFFSAENKTVFWVPTRPTFFYSNLGKCRFLVAGFVLYRCLWFWEVPPKGHNQVSTLQRCPHYRGRECMIFGISGTKLLYLWTMEWHQLLSYYSNSIKTLNCFIHRLVAKYSVKVIEMSTMVPKDYLLW